MLLCWFLCENVVHNCHSNNHKGKSNLSLCDNWIKVHNISKISSALTARYKDTIAARISVVNKKT